MGLIERLRILSEKYRLSFENATDVICTIDKDLIVSNISPSIGKQTGYAPGEFVGRPLSYMKLFFSKDTCETVEADLRMVLGGGSIQSVVYTITAKDGSLKHFEVNCSPVLRDGEVICAIAVARNVTDRLLSEDTLRESEDKFKRERKLAEEELRFRNIILSTQQETSIDGILVVDDNGGIISTNRRFAEMWSISHDNLSSLSGETIFYDALNKVVDSDEFRKKMENLHKGGTETSRDEISFKDGKVFDTYSAPMIDSGVRYFGRVWYFRDITAHKQVEILHRKLEEQLLESQKMEAIGSLAGGIAHDFNNLLTVILSFTEIASTRVRPGDPLLDDLVEVKKAGEYAASLTRQLLAFSRRQILELRPLDLNRVVVEVEKLLRRIIGEDIELVKALAPGLHMTLADPGQIEQVIMNLAINARDAMPGGGKLTIETKDVELDEKYAEEHVGVKPGSYVLLAVSDTGCGMNEHTRTHLFEPFFTTKEKEKGKGTGLGLSTVYGIVKQCGGSIWVYSEPGLGSTFKIYLPRDFAAPVSAVETALPPPPAGGTETVLVVEDDSAIRTLLIQLLESGGYTVLAALNADEAIETLARYKGEIRLLVTDVVMPGMNGRTLAERISVTRQGIKVLYMSGYADNAIIQHGVLDPGIHFIGKPFSASEFSRKIRDVLDG
jgi:two-component system cell cycle sensor histidine kinase/response regulator CckA